MKPIPWLCLVLLTCPCVTAADDTAVIEEKLHRFLAGVSAGDASVHEWFWAEDLVYTSSSGSRFGKAEILAPDEEEATADAAPSISPVYRAEDVDIRVYGNAAVLAFTLVSRVPAPDPGTTGVTKYLNTGTLLKRKGNWSVVAWQATRIPEQDPP